jgi:hypothetical protein
MISSGRNLLLVFNPGLLGEQRLEKQVACLHDVLQNSESPEQFCKAHELVNRNRITSGKKKIWKESRHFRLKPFRFLINKN